MVKVFFIINSLESGGAERVMSILANELSKLNYDISIISKVHKNSFYELNKNVKLIYTKKEISYKNKLTTLFDRLFVSIDIYNILKNEKPNIVIPFSTTTNGIIIIICRLLRLKVIACEHNNYRLNLKSLPIWFIKRIIYPKANMLTVLTNRDKHFYYQHFMKNVIVMPNPLPLRPLKFRNSQQRAKSILAIGNVNRWEQKGFDNLLKIFSQINKKYPDWSLLIAGGGNPDYLLTLALKLNISHKVEFLGEIQNVAEIMKQTEIFVLTSRYEGLPMVLLEAMSQGQACIAFDCFSGPADIITDGMDGILVEDQNIENFIDQLSSLIENSEKREILGKNAIETSKKYLPEKIIAQWHTLISDTI